MPIKLFDYLNHLGISKKEVEVYIYLLSVESALPMEISKDVGLKRSTVYVILDLLEKKKLVREIQRGKRFAYTAEDPERLKFLLEELKLETEKHIQSLDSMLPQLKAVLRKQGEPPVIKLFQGEKAVQASMEDLAQNPRFLQYNDYGVFSLELVYKLFHSKNLKQYIDFRFKKNKLYNVIYTADEGELQTGEGQIALKVNQKEFPFSCDITVFEDETRIHMLGKTIYGIVIKNPELAETLTSLIKLAMKGSSIK